MGSAYLEALNPGLLRRRVSLGEVKDPALLRETARLNRCLRRPPAEESVLSAPSAATTIPPPRWNRNRA